MGLVLLLCGACARQPTSSSGYPAATDPATPSAAATTVVQSASPATPLLTVDGPPRDPNGVERPGRPAPTTAEIYAAFTPSAQHSAVEVDTVAWTPHRIHSYRGRDGLPPLRVLSPVLTETRSLTVLPEAVRVQTEPNALVAAWADQLGCFCTGSRGILVRADAAGVAVIDVKTGADAGSYPILVASPSRSGLLVITVGAR